MRRKRMMNHDDQAQQSIYSLDINQIENDDLSVGSIPSYKSKTPEILRKNKKNEEELPTYSDFVNKGPTVKY
jgi:hypothetical protein